MKRIILSRKTGYDVLTPERPINIRDKNGRIFYSTESMVPNVRKFNLPSNIPLFIESGHFKTSENPVNYRLEKLPKKQRYFKQNPSRFKVIFSDNPNTCSILWNKKEIVFDKSLKEKTIPDNTFILYHEFGHQYYNDEHLADLFAFNSMLNRGYNPSQILQAPYNTLSDNNNYRKLIIQEKAMQL